MADTSKQGKAPNQILGLVLCIATPAVLVVMLGAFGIELMRGSLNQYEAPEPAPEEASAVTAAASTPAPKAPAETAAAAPKEGAPAESAAPAGGSGAVDPGLLETGKTVYSSYCIACHGPDGKGLVPGMAPQLVDSKVLNGPSEATAMTLLQGIVPEGKFTGVMVAWKDLLNDEQIAGVITYSRNNFGNSAPAVTPDQIAFARDKYKDKEGSFKRSEIEAVTSDLPK